MITKKTTHVPEALARLVQQFKGQVKLEALIASFVFQVQELEDAFFTILTDTVLDASVGEQLDGWGRIVDQARNDLVDDDYRLYIKAKLLIVRSNGSIEEMLTIVNLLTLGGMTIVLTENPVATDYAHFVIDITTDLPVNVNGPLMATLALRAKSAGVRGIISFKTAPSFRFDTVGRGFDQGNKFGSSVGA